MAHKNRFAQALRLASVAVLTLVVFAVALVQVQQHLLQHRAQLLLNDIRNLWIHPGTFDDLQLLQRRWGAFGHSEGSCTAEHCAYSITLTSAEPPEWLNDGLRSFINKAFILFGGRDVGILCGIIVHDDHTVLESLRFMIHVPDDVGIHPPLEYPGGYELEARIRSASRLFLPGGNREADLKRGYGIGLPGACHGCVEGWVNMTAQTNTADIKRLTFINLDCITRFRPCVDMDDLLPAAWSEFRSENREAHESPYATKCSVPPALFAREADNVALVEVLKVHPPEYPSEERNQGATIRILERFKDGGDHPVGSTANISYGGDNVYADPNVLSSANRKLAFGDRVFLLYPRTSQGQTQGLIDTGSCSLIPFSDATLQSVREGIAMDTSGDDLHDLPIPY